MLRLVAYLAFTACVVGGLYYSGHRADERAHQSTIAGCERSNAFREVLGTFLVTAEQARRTPPIDPGDERAADEYHQLAEKLLRAAKTVEGQTVVPTLAKPVVDCQAAFPAP